MDADQILAPLLDGHAFFQQPDCKRAHPTVVALGIGAQRPPDLLRLGKIRFRREYTDNGDRIAVQTHGATENGRVLSEQPLPKTVVHQCHVRPPGPVFLFREEAPGAGRKPNTSRESREASRMFTRSALSPTARLAPRRS